MKSPKIKALLLDFDDTCVHTIEPIWAIHKMIANTYYGKVIDDELIKIHWGKPLPELVKLLYGIDDHEAAFANISRHKDDKLYRKKFIAGVPEFLESISRTHTLGLVTAHTRDFLNIEFDYLAIKSGTFEYVETADDTKYHKPDPKVFEPAKKWLESKGILKEETLYVGDGLHDMQAALGAGFQFTGVATGLVSMKEFNNAGVYAVETLPQVAQLLAS